MKTFEVTLENLQNYFGLKSNEKPSSDQLAILITKEAVVVSRMPVEAFIVKEIKLLSVSKNLDSIKFLSNTCEKFVSFRDPHHLGGAAIIVKE